MITFSQARKIISSCTKSFGTEMVPLDDALDRTLAEDIYSDRDYPPFNRSAMDGIAIRYEDFLNGIRDFRIIETIYAGEECDISLTTGTCYKIMTGAAVPVVADAVIRNEDISFSNNGFAQAKTDACIINQNIAVKGEDLKKGERVLYAKQQISSMTISLLASLGKHRVLVKKLPVVSVFTTGNEIKPVDQPVTDVQIHNSNAHLLKALLKRNNISVPNIQHVPDNQKLLKENLEKGLSSDIMIINGGVSAGDADFVPETLIKLGATRLFHKVAIKPGKPIWCGKTDKCMIFALPGNPFSCLVTFKIFVEYYLNNCLEIENNFYSLPFSGNRSKKTTLDEFFPVQINISTHSLDQLPINGSGDIRLGQYAGAIALQPADTKVLIEGNTIKYLKIN